MFSALSIQHLFGLHGMELIDVMPQQTHGGSMRYVLAHRGAYPVKPSVAQLITKEKNQGLDKLETFMKFGINVSKSKKELVSLLTDLKSQGKRVAGYAANATNYGVKRC